MVLGTGLRGNKPAHGHLGGLEQPDPTHTCPHAHVPPRTHAVRREAAARASPPATTLLPELASPWDPESRVEGPVTGKQEQTPPFPISVSSEASPGTATYESLLTGMAVRGWGGTCRGSLFVLGGTSRGLVQGFMCRMKLWLKAARGRQLNDRKRVSGAVSGISGAHKSDTPRAAAYSSDEQRAKGMPVGPPTPLRWVRVEMAFRCSIWSLAAMASKKTSKPGNSQFPAVATFIEQRHPKC